MLYRVRGARLLLGFTILMLAACGGGYSSPSTPTTQPPAGGPAANVVVTVAGNDGGMSFSPATATLKVGQTVAWRNADAIVHDIAQDGGGFNTGALSPGATSAPVTINSAGQIAYHCTIHPGMVGALSVTQ